MKNKSFEEFLPQSQPLLILVVPRLARLLDGAQWQGADAAAHMLNGRKLANATQGLDRGSVDKIFLKSKYMHEGFLAPSLTKIQQRGPRQMTEDLQTFSSLQFSLFPSLRSLCFSKHTKSSFLFFSFLEDFGLLSCLAALLWLCPIAKHTATWSSILERT